MSIFDNIDFLFPLVKDKFTRVAKGYDLSYSTCYMKMPKILVVLPLSHQQHASASI